MQLFKYTLHAIQRCTDGEFACTIPEEWFLLCWEAKYTLISWRSVG